MSRIFAFRLPEPLRTYLESQAKQGKTSIGHYIVTLIDSDKTKKERAEKHGNRKAEAVKD